MGKWHVDTGSQTRSTAAGWVTTESVTVRFGDEPSEHLTPQEARKMARQLVAAAKEVEAGEVGA